MIYLPRWIEKGLKIKTGFHNYFHACLYDKEKYEKYGEKAPVVQEAKAYNVFCNQGLDYIYYANLGFRTPFSFMSYCGVGTGSGNPSVLDTTFFTFLSAANIATSGEVSNPMTYSINHETQEYYRRHKFFWDVDEGNGDLTEVGLCYYRTGSNYNNIITHALFKDANGNPITIHKDNTKVMVVTVTVYLERGTSDSGADILDDGVDIIISTTHNYLTLYYYTYYAEIYLGSADQEVTRGDCYGTNYPVLGNTRSYKNVAGISKPSSGYGAVVWADWNLNEGNGTWYEVGHRVLAYNTRKNLTRIDLPSGLIETNSITKDDTKKLRVTLEYYLTQ